MGKTLCLFLVWVKNFYILALSKIDQKLSRLPGSIDEKLNNSVQASLSAVTSSDQIQGKDKLVGNTSSSTSPKVDSVSKT